MPRVSDHLAYTDEDGNAYRLVYRPYEAGKGKHACHGCAFMGKPTACREAKPCTPKSGHGARLVGAGYVWERAQ
jgi:hypothetical protein